MSQARMETTVHPHHMRHRLYTLLMGSHTLLLTLISTKVVMICVQKDFTLLLYCIIFSSVNCNYKLPHISCLSRWVPCSWPWGQPCYNPRAATG